jgi:WD40 repeat protein
MNTNLLKALKEIISQYGGAETLADARRFKALLADLAAREPKPQKNVLVACIEQGFVPALQNVPAGERGAVKAKLVERLNREEGLDMTFCTNTLDLLETALFGEVSTKATPLRTAAPGMPAPLDAYYLSINYQQSGPFSLEQLKGMIGSRHMSKDYWIRIASGSDWMPVTTLSELKPFFGATEHAAFNQQPVTTRQGREVWRELRTLRGHTNRVWSVAYSPDGSRIASGSEDKTIKIWDAENGYELNTFKRNKKRILSVTYSPDGHRIASGSDDKTIRIWDAESGRELQTLKGHTSWVCSVAYSPDGRRIVSVSKDKTIKIWDAESGQILHTFKGHKKAVHFAAYSPDGRRIVSGSGDNTVRIWDVESGRELQTLTGGWYTGWGCSVAYSPNGRRIVSISVGSTIKIWDAESGQELHTLTDGGDSVTYSPDGRRIVSTKGKTIKIWDAESGQELQTLAGHTSSVYSVAYSPDGRRISGGSWDNTIKTWGVE